MTVADLIRRLKGYDPETLVVKFGDHAGFEECDMAMRAVMIRRRPKNAHEVEFVAAELKPRSRARRVVGVVVV